MGGGEVGGVALRWVVWCGVEVGGVVLRWMEWS